MSELEKKMDEYREKFGDIFPRMLCRGMDDERVIATIDKCLKDGKEYEPDAPEDADF